ncbi:hypothetical protein KC319_g22748, partial [Hortaea werneckii]
LHCLGADGRLVGISKKDKTPSVLEFWSSHLDKLFCSPSCFSPAPPGILDLLSLTTDQDHRTTAMGEKELDASYAQDEKIGAIGTEIAGEGRRDSLVDAARRQSVALNIVENPLKTADI